MKRFIQRVALCAVVLLVAFLCMPAASAAEYPALSDLYGRYVFNGTMTSLAEEQGEGALEPKARTGYTMVVLPGDGENEVKMLGFFGYGGGLTATYNEADGTLHCSQTAIFMVMNIGSGKGGMMAYVDAGAGKSLDLTFNVSREDGAIVMTAAEPLRASAMNSSYMGDKWTYAAGYTLTKQAVDIPQEEVVGKYECESNEVVNTMIEDVWEFFDLTVTSKEAGKVGVKGLFGLDDEIEARYFEDGGIILLPHDYTFANGMYMGDSEEDMAFNQEAAPYFLVGGEQISSASSFILNNGYDDVVGRPVTFSFIGGEGKKVPGSSVAHVSAGKGVEVLAGESALGVKTAAAGMVRLYDIKGALVGEKAGTSVRFGGLPAGVYVVKAAGQAVKAIVK